MALFATGSMTKRVQEVWSDLPIPGPAQDYDRNPFVTEIMRGAGAQQRQQTIHRLYDAFQTYFQNQEDDPSHNPPGPKTFYNPRWVRTGSSIQREGDTLILGGGRSVPPIKVEWPHPRPVSVEIGWDRGCPVVVATYDSDKQDLPESLMRQRSQEGKNVAGVDLGENNLATAYDGREAFVLNGGRLREMRSLQRREESRFDRRISRKQEGSRRWRKLVAAKRERLGEIADRVDDYLHKMSTRLVEELWERGVSTVVVGDLTGILEGVDFSSEVNNRLHRWPFRRFVERIEYKAERYGMVVEREDEAHTSSICPYCGGSVTRRRSRFRCRSCGREGHSDVMGAVNIRAKYQAPDGWKSGSLTADRATANEGLRSGSKTHEEGGASASKQTTYCIHSPRTISYSPHMECVLN
jgi:putative transposase